MLTVAAPDADRVKAVLRDHGIAATVRTDHIRFSPHASTSVATVDAIGAALRCL
jgi:hypothetical protein